MPLELGIILIILVLGLVGFIIYQYQNFKRKSVQNDKEISVLRKENKESRNKFEESCKRYDGLMSTRSRQTNMSRVRKHSLREASKEFQMHVLLLELFR